MPKFIGSYKVLKVMNNPLNITIALPQEFKDRRINHTFHTSLVQPYTKNNHILFPKRDTKLYYDFGNNEDQEWLVEEILAHKWTAGDVTWELLSSCKKLEALDNYLELRGAKAPKACYNTNKQYNGGSHTVTAYVT